MLNKFPLWKNLMLVLVIIIGFIFAAPNLFGDDPAVQITANDSSSKIDNNLISTVTQTLTTNNVKYLSAYQEGNSLVVRFNNTDTQFLAQSLIKNAVGQNYTAAVNLVPATPSWLRAIGANPVKLGLDLRGGIHFLLDVDVNGVIGKRLDGMVRTISDDLRKQDLRYQSIVNANGQIILQFKDADTLNQAMTLLKNDFSDLAFTIAPNNPLQITAVPLPAFVQNVQEYTLSQTITTLRNRINELGIAEPQVQQQGLTRISVDLPGVQDSARARQILGGTATLEFHMVNSSVDPTTVAATGAAPPGTKLYRMADGTPILLDTQVVLSGNSITSAASTFGQDGTPVVSITLGGGGEAYFSKVTQENVGKQMGIVYIETKTVDSVVDGKPVKLHQRSEKVISAPVIQDTLGSNFQITGISDPLQAKNLALLLRAGALPAAMDIIQERTVGPSLGMENIHMGVLSVEVAFVLIVIFMALYYGVFGIFADLALGLNLVLIIALLSILGATLTLPGIAGVVLTVGMAVDANVLIFERIREEIRNGNTPQAAIHAGFERAFSTIVDANVTTLIVAVVLFSVGSGPIQGFAVTLTIGLLTSMFTAITFTRALVNWVYGGRNVKKFSIGMHWPEKH